MRIYTDLVDTIYTLLSQSLHEAVQRPFELVMFRGLQTNFDRVERMSVLLSIHPDFSRSHFGLPNAQFRDATENSRYEAFPVAAFLR